MVYKQQYYLHIGQLEETKKMLDHFGSKLIFVAGGSASGKSYFAKQFKTFLEKMGKKVLSISSDDYYTDLTAVQFVLYGSFDHPHLIAYDELQQHLHDFFRYGKVTLPEYSFKERRRVATREVVDEFDFVIVEGLYTISQLSDHLKPFKIFVDAHVEELIFRRLIRDKERIAEPMHDLIASLGKVFPLWKLYGAQQREKADLVIFNDYKILDHQGQEFSVKRLDADAKSTLGTQVKKEFITDILYDDTYPGNGTVIVSEMYRERGGFLDSVLVSKRKLNGDPTKFTEISVRVNQPGFLTTIHTLLQTAGLQFVGMDQKTETTFEQEDGKSVILKEVGKEKFLKIFS